jgi:hypothetical protein
VQAFSASFQQGCATLCLCQGKLNYLPQLVLRHLVNLSADILEQACHSVDTHMSLFLRKQCWGCIIRSAVACNSVSYVVALFGCRQKPARQQIKQRHCVHHRLLDVVIDPFLCNVVTNCGEATSGCQKTLSNAFRLWQAREVNHWAKLP